VKITILGSTGFGIVLLLSLIAYNNTQKGNDYSFNPCGALRGNIALPDKRTNDEITAILVKEVPDFIVFKNPDHIRGNTYSLCVWSVAGSAVNLRVSKNGNRLSVERRESKMNGIPEDPRIEGDVLKYEIDLFAGSPAYKKASELFDK
jgi:hypothetical protein